MSSFIANLADQLQAGIDPNYNKEKQQLHKTAQVASLISISILISSVALLVLGITLCCSGAVIAGSPLILVATPLCYFSFNAYKTCENLKTIAANPKRYQEMLGFGDNLDKDKLRAGLTENTICFEWFADLMLDNFAY